MYGAILLLPALLICGPLLERAQLSERRRDVGGSVRPQAAAAVLAAPVQAPTIAPPAKEYIYAGDRLVATKQPILFEDVSSGSQYYQDITTIARLEITLGTQGAPHPLFAPLATVTREQMAAFIIRALGNYFPPPPPMQRFDDVPPSNIFYKFIDQMAVLMITAGCSVSPPLYCPTGVVTHEQMATFMTRAAGFLDPAPPPSQYFCDVLPSNIFYKFIHSYAVDRQVWPGCDCTQSSMTSCQNQASPVKPCFCPDMLVSREQMARILVKNFNLGP